MNGTDTLLNKTNVFILQVLLPISQEINQKYIHTFLLMDIKYIQSKPSSNEQTSNAQQMNKRSCINKGHAIRDQWELRNGTKTVMGITKRDKDINADYYKTRPIQGAGGGERDQWGPGSHVQ